jgi:DNA-binding NarL/FixJ family response regulator
MEIQAPQVNQEGLGQIKIMIVDDHTILRDSLRALFGAYDDIKIIGEASDGEQALDKARELDPDVIVMDLALRGMDGAEAIQRLVSSNPKAKVLVLTQYSDREHVISSIKAGACGYIPKQASGPEVVAAIRTVFRGEYFLFPFVASTLVQDYLNQSRKEPYDRLTRREREVLGLIAEGKTSRQIAGLLSVSLKTVLGHRNKLMKKLDIHNRTELIKYAIRLGLVKMDEWTAGI